MTCCGRRCVAGLESIMYAEKHNGTVSAKMNIKGKLGECKIRLQESTKGILQAILHEPGLTN